MVDEIYDRDYQNARSALNGGFNHIVSRFAGAIGNAFEVLNRIEYSSPWAAKPKRARAH